MKPKPSEQTKRLEKRVHQDMHTVPPNDLEQALALSRQADAAEYRNSLLTEPNHANR